MILQFPIWNSPIFSFPSRIKHRFDHFVRPCLKFFVINFRQRKNSLSCAEFDALFNDVLGKNLCAFLWRAGPYPRKIEKLFHLQQKCFTPKKSSRNVLLKQSQPLYPSTFQAEILHPCLLSQGEIAKTYEGTVRSDSELLG